MKKNITVCISLLFFVMLAAKADAGRLFVDKTPARITARGDYFSFSFDMERGVWNAGWSDGRPLARNAYAMWALDNPSGPGIFPLAGGMTRRARIENFIDRLGEGKQVIVTSRRDSEELSAETVFRFYYGAPFFVVIQRLHNGGSASIDVTRAYPLITESKRGGGFFPGPDPRNVWVLENGYKRFFDFYLRVVPGSDRVDSNWDAAFYDRRTRRTSIIGFLNPDHGYVSVRSFYDREKTIETGGWSGLSSLKAESLYEPARAVPAGETYEAERLYIGLSTESMPHPTLERFADAAALHYNIRPWDGDIPNGWNIWATKYHHEFNEEIILENARRAAEDLKPFGMNTFQIDDGYQQAHGDWFANDNFPRGMGWIASEIEKLGFQPGIWIQPFCISKSSRLAAEHPGWIAPKSKLGEEMIPSDWLILDPTHPEVQEWLDTTFRRYTRQWGFKVIKIDFVYFVQLAKSYHDPGATAVDAYRAGVETIRNAMPDDAFLFAVGVPTANSAGLVEGMRIGLDITPEWADGEGYAVQGVKPMVRNVARRYYLNHRLWINHPDMFYLGSPEEEQRWGSRLSFQEARTYATLACIQGGIVKIGDSFTGLDDRRTDLLRRLLPVYPRAARPVDLFEKLYPEVWHLDVLEAGLDYDVVTFFNWGRNRVWGEEIEEADREIMVNMADIGLSPLRRYLATEFWSGEYLGEFRGVLRLPVKARDVKVIALHEKLDRPQFIGSNRHVTQGATDMGWINWMPESNTLRGSMDIDPGFDYRLLFHVPDGYRPAGAKLGGERIVFTFTRPVMTLKFDEDTSSRKVWEIEFVVNEENK